MQNLGLKKTIVTFVDGTTSEYLIEGFLEQESLPFDILKEVTIGNKVTHIDDNAFWMQTSLETVNIPNSVILIGSNAFLSTNIKSITIPKSVTRMKDGALAVSGIETINLPDTLIENIGYAAFLTGAPNISIPNRTMDRIKYLFEHNVFGNGENEYNEAATTITVTCKDGVIHAVGKWNETEMRGDGWDITVTPL